jgi:hypothetical protein
MTIVLYIGSHFGAFLAGALGLAWVGRFFGKKSHLTNEELDEMARRV